MHTLLIAALMLSVCGGVAQAHDLPLTARGNEPGWVLTLATEGVVLSEQSGGAAEWPLPLVQADGVDLVYPLGAGDILRLSPGVCRDSMTGMPYPLTATLERPGGTLSGRGGAPFALLSGAWRLVDLRGQTLPADAGVTLEVAADQVTGQSACNRYSGAFSIGGESVAIGPLGATRMACAKAQMALEQAYLEALGRVSGFDMSDTGDLILLAEGDAVARFSR